MGVRRIISSGGAIVDFWRGMAKRIFPGRPTVLEFHFANSETKGKTFFY